VQPLESGFVQTRIAPQPADLRWARGTVPTPLGPVEVCWQHGDDGIRFQMEVSWPAEMAVELEVPIYRRDAPTILVDGVACEVAPEGRTVRISRPAAEHRQRCVVVTH